MRCRHCNVALPPSRSFIDGEFCCDAHRQVHEMSLAPESIPDAAATEMAAEYEYTQASGIESAPSEPEPEAVENEAYAVESYAAESSAEAETNEDDSLDHASDAARETARSWQWIRTAWKGAPRDLKLIS